MVYPMSSLGRASLCLLLATGLSRADFLSDVRPTLKTRCFSCHGALKAEADLRLDSVALMQKGGESGPLLADSGRLLLERITAPASHADRMPPEGAPLSSSQIDAVRSWLASGAPAPTHDDPEPDPRSHWAFQPPTSASPPPAALPDWNLSLIDQALAARHAAAAISPQSPAPPSIWLRRVAFDLTGLPPSSTLSASFLADPSPDARATVVDQLLASPERITRLILCSGKVYYDLLEFRAENKIKNAAIIRIEQLYPLNYEMLKEIVAKYPRAQKKWIWCQEEPRNMGAFYYIRPRLEELSNHKLRYSGRERSSSPAAGSKAIHVLEQDKLVADAFSV
jgi:hypothetical protein